MGRAEGEKGGDQWRSTDELWLQWPAGAEVQEQNVTRVAN